MQQELPETVYAVGIVRDGAAHHTPIATDEGMGVAPLTVLDADGERALPVFTTPEKAERGIEHFLTEDERANNLVGAALVKLASLVDTMREEIPGMPKVDYIGVTMGEGGIYPLIRL